MLGAAEAAALLTDCERGNRLAAFAIRAMLGRRTGWPFHGPPATPERLVRELPQVAFAADRGDCEPHAARADVRGTRW